MQKMTTPTFEVTTLVTYVPEESHPEQGSHLFSYRIRITNTGSAPAQLMSRHWIITDAYGHKEEVRGPGVVGMQPKIQPGQTFEYESACPLTSSTGTMKGQYQFVMENGESFAVQVPEFYLIAPSSLH